MSFSRLPRKQTKSGAWDNIPVSDVLGTGRVANEVKVEEGHNEGLLEVLLRVGGHVADEANSAL